MLTVQLPLMPFSEKNVAKNTKRYVANPEKTVHFSQMTVHFFRK